MQSTEGSEVHQSRSADVFIILVFTEVSYVIIESVYIQPFIQKLRSRNSEPFDHILTQALQLEVTIGLYYVYFISVQMCVGIWDGEVERAVDKTEKLDSLL